MNLLHNISPLELENGVRLYVLPRCSSAVEMQFHIASGSIHEGRFLGCGLSHFLEHMAFQGCKNYPGTAVADRVNELGGDVNAYTSYDRTCYRMQLPVQHLRQGMKMLAAMVRSPRLPAARFEAERDVILRECERGMDNPDSRLHEAFMKQMFLRHPLRHPVIGYKEMIAAVTRDMAMEYHETRYTPQRCVVTVVGGVEPEAVFEALQDYLGDWERKHLAEMVLPFEPEPATLRRSGFFYPDPLHRVMCGVRAPEFGSPELPVLELLFSILGTGESSILNRKLVLENPLALSVRSACYSLGDNSFAVIAGKSEPGKLPQFCDAVRGELIEVASGNIPVDHMIREKEQQYADRLRELRDNINVAGEIAGGVLYAADPLAGESYLDALAKVELPELQRVAAKFLDLSHWVSVRQDQEARAKKIVSGSNPRQIITGTLDNGVKTVCVPDNELPLCNFFMVVPGGALVESAGECGITKLVAASLTCGSAGLSENDILQKLDEAGVDLEISGGLNSMTLEFSAPRKNFDRAIEVISATLHEPLFPDNGWKREVSRHLNELQEQESHPVKRAFMLAAEKLFAGHPYAGSGYGRAETVNTLSGADAMKHYRRMLYAPQTVFGFGGDCSASDVARWSEILKSALPWSNCAPVLPDAAVFPAQKIFAELALPREQTVAVRMLPGIAYENDLASDVSDLLFQAENGLASELFKLVREKHALSYSVGMTHAAGFHPGYFAFYAMTAPGAGEKVLKLLDSEVKRIADKGLSGAEIKAAKNNLLFENQRTFDMPETLVRTAAMECFYGFDAAGLQKREERIRAITPEQCNLMLKKLFTAARGVEVLVRGQGK